MTILDAPAPIRPGEELDLAKLGPYLRDRLGRPDGDVRVEQFPGGHSNLTYLVRLDGRELVLRRPPFGSKVRTAHDMGREHRVLSALWRPYPRAPRPALFCDDESVLGAKFYLMERVRGVVLRRRLPAGLAIAPATAERLCEAFLDALVDLHALDYRAIGLAEVGRPQGYVARQIEGWTR